MNLSHHSCFLWASSSSGKLSQLVFLVESIKIDLDWNTNYSLFLELILQAIWGEAFSHFSLLDRGKQEAQRKLLFSACSKAVRRDPYFKFHFREASKYIFNGSLKKLCIICLFCDFWCAAFSLCLFFDSSQSCAPEPPVSPLGHRQRHSEMFAVSRLHHESFLGQWLDISLTEQNIFSAYHTIII